MLSSQCGISEDWMKGFSSHFNPLLLPPRRFPAHRALQGVASGHGGNTQTLNPPSSIDCIFALFNDNSLHKWKRYKIMGRIYSWTSFIMLSFNRKMDNKIPILLVEPRFNLPCLMPAQFSTSQPMTSTSSCSFVETTFHWRTRQSVTSTF